MDENKKIILKEIEYWKKNKILPKHYCDFLTTLYTEGSEKYSPNHPFTSRLKRNFPYILFAISILLSVAMITFLGYYFNDFSIQLQIALFCFLLFLAGVIFKWFYIQFFGLFALTALMGWSSLPYIEENFSWLLFEGSWVGVSSILLFSAWIIRGMNMKLSLNLFIHGVLTLFVPLIQGMFLEEVTTYILQLVLFTKLIFISLFLFMSRKILDVYVKVFS